MLPHWTYTLCAPLHHSILGSLENLQGVQKLQVALDRKALGSCRLLTKGPAAGLDAAHESITTCHKVDKSNMVWAIKTALKTIYMSKWSP